MFSIYCFSVKIRVKSITTEIILLEQTDTLFLEISFYLSRINIFITNLWSKVKKKLSLIKISNTYLLLTQTLFIFNIYISELFVRR